MRGGGLVPAASVLLAAALLGPTGSAEADAATARPAGDTIRVVTYNIHAGRDADGKPNLGRVAGVLEELRADVVLLQEVDRGTERSGGADQLARLRELTGFHGVFGRSLLFQGGEYGIAVLSRWPVEAARTIPLPVEPPAERAGGSHEPRVALSVRVAGPGGPLRIVNTHLDAYSGAHRAQEMVALLSHLADLSAEGPVLVGGDLNALPESPVARAPGIAFVDLFRACGAGGGETFPAQSPERRIDYLFARAGIRCLEARVPGTEASDHRPVAAVLEVVR